MAPSGDGRHESQGAPLIFFETTLTQDRIDRETAGGYWPGTRLVDRLDELASSQGAATLVIDPRRTWTYSDVATASRELALGLLDLGVRRGDVVQLQLPNWGEFMVAVLGVERIGAVVNPVAPIFRTNEVAVMSELARPHVVITAGTFRGFDHAEMHTELMARCPWVQTVITVAEHGTDSEQRPGTLAWDAVLGAGRESKLGAEVLDLLAADPNEVCEVQFTSGTTGQPKGVMHTQNTLAAPVGAAKRRLDLGSDDVIHMASTLAHQTGYLYGTRLPIEAGGAVVYQDVWDPVGFVRLIAEHRVTFSMGATPFLADLLAAPNLTDHDISSFAYFVCAGAAIPKPILEQAGRELPCAVMPGWGMTECALATSCLPTDPLEVRLTDGKPIEGNEVRVVDDDGAPAGVDTEGDLQYRGSFETVGYVQGRALTNSCYTADGWLETGDRARMDGEGYITITGRTKDIVIRGGENIPVKEVEDILLRHPAVANVAVVAKTHDRLGEVGCACVLPEGDAPTLADLVDFLSEQGVTKQFWPEALEIVDSFPMTPSGKIQKYVLRNQID